MKPNAEQANPVSYGGTIYCPHCGKETAEVGGKSGVIYCKHCSKPFLVKVGASETK